MTFTPSIINSLYPPFADKTWDALFPAVMIIEEYFIDLVFTLDSTRVPMQPFSLSIECYCCAGSSNGECFGEVTNDGSEHLLLYMLRKQRSQWRTLSVSPCVYVDSTIYVNGINSPLAFNDCIGIYDSSVSDEDFIGRLYFWFASAEFVSGAMVDNKLVRRFLYDEPICPVEPLGILGLGQNLLTSFT